ncbi:hypothetical protein QC762_115495 [Podospora pseudocomata]|uniref:RanBP2-type domain-containing protein n=1 Tax=Podospora pseudocomata TaxID=2093779 RepID=A0ABR0GW85_9PEZI|nr:hypothetical protein QC762_115495 [Podospora pseudocomata]
MASNNSLWLSDEESDPSHGGSCSTVIHHGLPASNANNSPSSESTITPDSDQGGSLLALSFSKRTVLAAGNERILPPRRQNLPSTNSTQSWDTTADTPTSPRKTTIKIVGPSLAELHARRNWYNARFEQARIDHETSHARAYAEQEKEWLDGELRLENFVTGQAWLDNFGERHTKNKGAAQGKRVWTCCGCECYNSRHEHKCSHCRVHVKCGECERRYEQQGRFKINLD